MEWNRPEHPEDPGSIFHYLNTSDNLPHALFPGTSDEPIWPENSLLCESLAIGDPDCTSYRSLHMFASASVVAPRFARLGELSKRWRRYIDDCSNSNLNDDGEPFIDYMVPVDHWLSIWVTWLYYHHIVPLHDENVRNLNFLRAIRRQFDRSKDEAEHLLDGPLPDSWFRDDCARICDGFRRLEEAFREGGAQTDVRALFSQVPLRARAIAILIGTERLWERMLESRHVEGMHLSKRIWLFKQSHVARASRRRLQKHHRDSGQVLEENIRAIQGMTNSIDTLRFLREHHARRPWQQLYLVVDPPEGSPTDIVVDEINRRFGEDETAARSFQVHPMRKRNMAPDDKRCMICCEDYKSEDLLLYTWCKHLFHAVCVYRFWDQTMTKGLLCPYCRQETKTIGQSGEFEQDDPHPAPSGHDLAQEVEEIREANDWLETFPNEPPTYEVRFIKMREYWRRKIEEDKEQFVGKRQPYDWWPIDFEWLRNIPTREMDEDSDEARAGGSDREDVDEDEDEDEDEESDEGEDEDSDEESGEWGDEGGDDSDTDMADT